MTRSLNSRFEGTLAGLEACDSSGEHSAAAEALATSLLERRGFDSDDQAKRLKGLRFNPLACIAPLAMYLLHDAARAKDLAADVSLFNGGSRESVDACRYLTGLMIGALRGDSKATIMGDLYSPVYNYWFFRGGGLSKRVDAVARGVYQNRETAELETGGRPADILETALWALHRNADFSAGAAAAEKLGGETDLRGAVYGQLAGALYGIDAIPAGEFVRPRELAAELLGATGQGIRHFTSWDQMRA